MATVAAPTVFNPSNQVMGEAPVVKKEVDKNAESVIPDIIEDRRKDSEGRIVSAKYVKGKLLGKGGFAKCFVGHLLPSKAPYALKIVAKSSVTKSR